MKRKFITREAQIFLPLTRSDAWLISYPVLALFDAENRLAVRDHVGLLETCYNNDI